MQRDQLLELQFLTAKSNLPSMMERGILSHARADDIEHESVADPEMLARRARKRVLGGLRLLQYANLYICVRNAMMFTVASHFGHRNLCVLAVNPSVLDIPDTAIADQGAAKDWPRFEPSPDGLKMIDYGKVHHPDWDESGIANHKALKMAEVLVPHQVPWSEVDRVYVSCQETAEELKAVVAPLNVVVAE
ncbi:MAG: DUF4433 domain-containing protein [Chloroflexi bacterium]|nr:DUF4433 domain-containing protein [Chloroflexota bacterium]